MSSKVVIGIDLGTTNSCVAVVCNGAVHVIANEPGHRITPSVVAFTQYERLIGNSAKAQATFNHKNTVYEVKRLIGRKFDDPLLENDFKHWPFEVRNVGGNPMIAVEFKGEPKIFTPEEISSMVLSEMKKIAETYLSEPVSNAVITVPAYFNDSQRQATIDAGTIAGLNVLKIINEPTAAAIAYGVDKIVEEKRNVLIYDLGGGTFDVVVMSIEKGNFEVLAVNGDTRLGGGDFDKRLVDHFVKEILVKHGMDISEDKRAKGKLRKACEKVKQCLSSAMKSSLQVDAFLQGVDYVSSLSRTRFELLCSDLFSGTIDCVQTVLDESGLSKDEIHEVVLAGGSTRIPKIQQLLQDFFPGKTLNRTINPDEAVAYGAAMHAAILSGENSVAEFNLADVTPLSLGIQLIGDRMETIIPRNTKIPTKVVRKNYTTASSDFQKILHILIYEGERRAASSNQLLGDFIAEGIEIAPMGVPKVNITFEIDANGILHATAVDAKTGSASGVTITSNKGRLKKEELSRMVAEAKELSAGAEQRKEMNKAMNDLEGFIMNMKISSEKKRISGDLARSDFAKIDEACDETMIWLEDNEKASKEECVKKKKNLEKYCAKIIAEYN